MTNIIDQGLPLTPRGNVSVELKDAYGESYGAQNPITTGECCVYAKDVWAEESDIGGFSGAIADIFDNLHSVISNASSDNPKEILIHFQRTVVTNAVGLGAYAGNFSNVKILGGNSGGIFSTLLDESASSTKHTSRKFQLPVTEGFNAIKIQFHTSDAVSLSNCVILKTSSVVARLQAVKPTGTVTDINATNGGNLKVSLEELENSVSVNGNTQLKTTAFGSTGIEAKQDRSTGAMACVDYEHLEVHAGGHFFIKDWTDIAGGAAVDFLVVTPNTTKWAHMLFEFAFEAEANIAIYEGAEASANGTPIPVNNRNRNSANTAGLTVFAGPTVTATGARLAGYKAGSGKSVGGDARASAELVLKQNTKYLIRVVNDTVSNNWCDYLADWYEHTNLA